VLVKVVPEGAPKTLRSGACPRPAGHRSVARAFRSCRLRSATFTCRFAASHKRPCFLGNALCRHHLEPRGGGMSTLGCGCDTAIRGESQSCFGDTWGQACQRASGSRTGPVWCRKGRLERAALSLQPFGTGSDRSYSTVFRFPRYAECSRFESRRRCSARCPKYGQLLRFICPVTYRLQRYALEKPSKGSNRRLEFELGVLR
jgi:hypothetical protein